MFRERKEAKEFIKSEYRKRFGREINLDSPQTFNEKLQWLKLYDRKKKYIKMVDKYEAKEYVKKIIGEDHIIPTIGIYDSFDEIDFKKLPKKFMMKCTHDSGGNVPCIDKSKLNIEEAKEKINSSLSTNYYYKWREWPYKYVKPRIIIEKHMEDKETKELRDYKFFCFDGVAKFMFIATDRNIHETKFNFYDMDFNLLPFKQHYPNDTRRIKKPKTFDEMKKLAEKLSKGIPQVRVDFYEIDGKVHFGELTFCHFAALTPFEPEEWDYKLGEYINLPRKSFIDKIFRL